MKRLLYRVSFSALAVILLGCYPQGPEYAEDLDVVYTTFDKTYEFHSKSTYALPDKIVVDVKIDNGDTTYVYMKDIFASPILAAIHDKMAENGWSVEDPEDADIIITPAAIKSTTYFYSYWYDWWYGYGGWYGGYWGWYYPPYYTVSSYTTGSLILVMADPSAAESSPIERSPAVWVAVGNGLFTGSYNISRVTNAIDQAFTQSPYLKLN
jgi:hypothetical protein